MKFKKGDFVSTESGSWTFIIKEPISDKSAHVYAGIGYNSLAHNAKGWFDRLATPEEKQKLLDVLAKHGFSWDEENLELIDEI